MEPSGPPQPSGTVVHLRGVGRRYGLRGPWVLRGVDLVVPRGSLVRVEGTNGTGKSTLLRLVAGIDRPTTGRVGGRPRTAYVPERFPAALPFTATDYLVRMGRVHGLGRQRAARAAGEWLERFGAAGHARTPLAELSKGTSQKVAVAQALLADPELLVLDEAWTGLDQRARAELDRAVAARVAAGGAVVFVDHDPLRLAGAPDAVYRIQGSGLAPAPQGMGSATTAVPSAPTGHTDPVGSAARPGPLVLIEVAGPPGAVPPSGLPGDPEVAGAPGGGSALTVPAAHSDAVLRALLTADPPWHVRAVTPLRDRPRTGPPPTRGPSGPQGPGEESETPDGTEGEARP
ncbi:ATP-binding cassette domain-containing protein [Streptomyces sp. HSW2009]|uniref:ATP-binding cassette domain-containing protein n=1 Tax=Streptomyces sp. HSW2009 TaxID=3142890 RepID=UPI0032EEC3E3